jgi:hypothetical protein
MLAMYLFWTNAGEFGTVGVSRWVCLS